MTHLIVVRAFGPYRVGDVINGADAVAEVSGSEHASHVVRIQPPEPEADDGGDNGGGSGGGRAASRAAGRAKGEI